ncbi:hypothetical protein GQ600_13045 [Phytophthora cactorum]|nr:hypothetical protein GQ600_13045 [Phytophthora cactorum]
MSWYNNDPLDPDFFRLMDTKHNHKKVQDGQHATFANGPLPALPVDAHILQRVNDFLMPEAINAAVPRVWKAMDGAAARGRLDILERLYPTRVEGCSADAFIGAAANGHLDVLSWLYESYPALSDPTNEMVAAAGHGHLRVVKSTRRRVPFLGINRALKVASANGHVNGTTF